MALTLENSYILSIDDKTLRRIPIRRVSQAHNLPTIKHSGGYLYVESPRPITSIRIYTADGHLIRSEPFKSSKVKIPLRDLPKGVYMAVVESGRRHAIYRFIRLSSGSL